MDAISAIKGCLDVADLVGMAYVGDMTDQELMQRPHPDCNSVNWQIGHLICSEHQLLESIAPGTMPALPDGFSEKYSREAAAAADAGGACSKDELLGIYRQQRAATQALLASMSNEQLDEPTGINYAPTKGAMFRMQAEHWLMHCGQWVVVRRMCGKPVVI